MLRKMICGAAVMGCVLAMALPADASVTKLHAKWGTDGQAALVIHPREWSTAMTVHGLQPGTYDYSIGVFIGVDGVPVSGGVRHICKFAVHSAKETHTCTAQGQSLSKGWPAGQAPNLFTAVLDREVPHSADLVEYGAFS
jgi:hypothetical protein